MLEETLTSSTKWYDIGLRLKVPVNKLDGIRSQFSDSKGFLCETLKEWLKGAARSRPTWGALVEALRSQTVGEPNLADQLEAKHCQSERMSKGSCIYTTEISTLTHFARVSHISLATNALMHSGLLLTQSGSVAFAVAARALVLIGLQLYALLIALMCMY